MSGKLVIATGNPGKLAEFKVLFEGSGIEILSLADFPGMPLIEENGGTFLENALIKARATGVFTGCAVLADDSGLEVDALAGLPGIYSARFAPSATERNIKLLKLMEKVSVYRRTARFVCALALVRPEGFEWTTVGICEGLITFEPSGSGGFGYDPLFLYPPLQKTFAEIPLDEKNLISHRGRALQKFKKAVLEDKILT
ncbi:MAG: RdgB/HAM1 family non-canonical purine NTP pyrophosphatase [Candidatus Latescibacterota bacterium]